MSFANMRQKDVLEGYTIPRSVLDLYQRQSGSLIVKVFFPGRLVRRSFPRHLCIMITFYYQALAIIEHPDHAIGHLARIRYKAHLAARALMFIFYAKTERFTYMAAAMERFKGRDR